MISLEEIWERSTTIVNMINATYKQENLSEADNLIVSELKNACMQNVVLASLLSKIRSKHKAAAFDIELFLQGFNDV